MPEKRAVSFVRLAPAPRTSMELIPYEMGGAGREDPGDIREELLMRGITVPPIEQVAEYQEGLLRKVVLLQRGIDRGEVREDKHSRPEHRVN